MLNPRLALVALLLSGTFIQAQFGPGASSSSSLGPAPTESIGCVEQNGEWQCAGPRQTPSSASTTATSTDPSTSASSNTQASSGNQASPSIPPPPAESTGCVLHIDHYHCEGPAEGFSGTPTTNSPTVPSPTESSNCFWHETHWDCFDTAQEAEEAQSADESGECIIHVGHTHGDCSAEQLACGAVLLEDYGMPLHIGSVFIVLISSGLGVLIPLITFWFRRSESEHDLEAGAKFGRETGLWGNIFFLARHFGTGIIISTAFIHLLFHGFVMFANECVGHLSYESTAPAISMAAAFITFLLDFFGRRYAHGNQGYATAAILNAGAAGKEERSSPTQAHDHHSHDHHNFDAALAAEKNWQVLLLEAGIIFHSIMIGVTLGAGSGNGWTTLLIVIVFHQFFEGSALGARIALLSWIPRWKALTMGLAFTLITPLGIAIGIGVRESFSQNGKASLLSVGILNCISAGILLYTAFSLLSEDFTDGPLRRAGMSKVLAAFAALVAGLIAMSVLGKWA